MLSKHKLKRKQKLRQIRNHRKNYTKKIKQKKILNPKKIIVLLVLFFLYLLIYLIKKKNPFKLIIKKENKTKVCVCTFGKQENLYIREFVEHYKNYGLHKIYLYDNNDVNGEKFEDVINDYIKSGFVNITDWRGRLKIQFKMMNDCYKKHKEEYDWVMFPDLDEFVHLHNNYTGIGTFLNEPKFNKCEIVYFNLVCHTDNEQLRYENKPLKERFPNIVPKTRIGGIRLEVKFALRGHLNVYLNAVHTGNGRLKNCNTYGHANKVQGIISIEPDTTYYYYDHYYSKSTEEFIKKIIRGDSEEYHDKFRKGRIKKYFEENSLTLEKILMMENATGFNLSSYKEQLNKSQN